MSGTEAHGSELDAGGLARQIAILAAANVQLLAERAKLAARLRESRATCGRLRGRIAIMARKMAQGMDGENCQDMDEEAASDMQALIIDRARALAEEAAWLAQAADNNLERMEAWARAAKTGAAAQAANSEKEAE